MAICWERAALLAFRLCCFTLCRLNRFCSFPIRFFLGQEVEFDCISSWSLPFHQLYNMYLIMMSSWAFKPFGMWIKFCSVLFKLRHLICHQLCHIFLLLGRYCKRTDIKGSEAGTVNWEFYRSLSEVNKIIIMDGLTDGRWGKTLILNTRGTVSRRPFALWASAARRRSELLITIQRIYRHFATEHIQRNNR